RQRVGRDRNLGRAVLQVIEFFGRHEAGARIGRLHAEDPVELCGMAARLVDLERRLAGIENERLDATGALRRAQQRDRLFCDPARVPVELERRDVLVAGRPLVPAERIRVRPVLDLVGDVAVASIPAPLSKRSCSMNAPSVEAKSFCCRMNSIEPSRIVTPLTEPIAASARSNKSTFSASGTANGSRSS